MNLSTSGTLMWLAAASTAIASLAGCTSPAAVVPPPINRFVIVHSPHVERDTVLLDTVTGRAWTLVSYTDLEGDPMVWELMPQVGSTADRLSLVERFGTKEAELAARAATKTFEPKTARPEDDPHVAKSDKPGAEPARSKPPWEDYKPK